MLALGGTGHLLLHRVGLLRPFSRDGSHRKLSAYRGGGAPDAHLRLWGGGAFSVPESLGVQRYPKESWGSHHSGTGESHQMYVSNCGKNTEAL